MAEIVSALERIFFPNLLGATHFSGLRGIVYLHEHRILRAAAFTAVWRPAAGLSAREFRYGPMRTTSTNLQRGLNHRSSSLPAI